MAHVAAVAEGPPFCARDSGEERINAAADIGVKDEQGGGEVFGAG